jgi:hypothetical protein
MASSHGLEWSRSCIEKLLLYRKFNFLKRVCILLNNAPLYVIMILLVDHGIITGGPMFLGVSHVISSFIM